MLALTQANMRLALKLAETWRESGQKIIEIGGRGASEVAEETRAAISKRAEGGTVALPNTGHLQDYLGELESLRVATAEKVEEAVADWRNGLSSTVSSSLDAKARHHSILFSSPGSRRCRAVQRPRSRRRPSAANEGRQRPRPEWLAFRSRLQGKFRRHSSAG
jgi:hypothetical protein